MESVGVWAKLGIWFWLL